MVIYLKDKAQLKKMLARSFIEVRAESVII